MISQKTITIISVAVMVFIAGAILLWQMPKGTPEPSASPTTTSIVFEQVSFPAPSPVALIKDSGVIWLQQAVKIQCDQSVFNSNFGCYNEYGDFYKVGTQDGKDLILVLIHEMGTSSYLFRKEGTRYAMITNGKTATSKAMSCLRARQDILK